MGWFLKWPHSPRTKERMKDRLFIQYMPAHDQRYLNERICWGNACNHKAMWLFGFCFWVGWGKEWYFTLPHPTQKPKLKKLHGLILVTSTASITGYTCNFNCLDHRANVIRTDVCISILVQILSLSWPASAIHKSPKWVHRYQWSQVIF